MTETLRPVRIAAAWTIIAFVGLTEVTSLLASAMAAWDRGVRDAILQTYLSSTVFALLLAVAVAVTGVVTPTSPGARTIALVAFAEAGGLLIWSVVYGAVLYLESVTALFNSYGDPLPGASVQRLLLVALGAALSALAAVFAWRVYIELDPLAGEIADLSEQLAELDEEEESQARGAAD